MLDPLTRRVTVSGGEVALTATEFDLLAFLLRRPGRVFSREQLISEVWGYATAGGGRTVDVHVAQVRGKLGAASPIRTVRGVSYPRSRTRDSTPGSDAAGSDNAANDAEAAGARGTLASASRCWRSPSPS